MKKKPNFNRPYFASLLLAALGSSMPLQAQSLQVDGNLDVKGNTTIGDSTTKGSLTITGPTGASAAPALSLIGDGGIIFKGTLGTGPLPNIAIGAQLLWVPKVSALWGGYSSTGFPSTNLGSYSFSYGYDSVAWGAYSLAIGKQASAFSSSSVAIGEGAVADASDSFAMGLGTYVGKTGGVAIGKGTKSNTMHTVVLGSYNSYWGYDVDDWIDEDPIFIVGNGTGNASDPNFRKNHDALVVTKAGVMNLFPKSTTTHIPATIVLDPNTAKITLNGAEVLTSAYVGNLSMGDNSGPVLSSHWKGAQAIGNSGYDKVVFGPLVHNYTGATIGANNNALNGWVDLNITSENLVFRTGGETEVARLTAGGSLGLGTTAPSAKLEVAGATGSGAAPALKVTGDGGVAFEGTFGSGSLQDIVVGTQLRWIPKKAAFWGGYYSQSNPGPNYGEYSFAYGLNASAPAKSGVALGTVAGAYGAESVALGRYATTEGEDSIAIGKNSYAIANESVALGESFTSGLRSFAAGQAFASGENSIAMGYYASAGDFAVAIGSSAYASGVKSVALGATHSSSYGATVVGHSNAMFANASQSQWVDTDEIFVVGNGTGVETDPFDKKNHSALVITKNGKMSLYAKSTATSHQPPTIVLDPNTAKITLNGQEVLTTNSGGAFSIGSTGQTTVASSSGQPMFVGRQVGNTYSYPSGIFQAVTDNPDGTLNNFFEGKAGGVNGVTNFTVRADGQAYFAGSVGLGTDAPSAKLEVVGATGASAPPALKVSGDGGVAFEGVFGAGSTQDIIEGSQLRWVPKKAAFWGGYSSVNSAANYGNYSFSYGVEATAIGEASFAFGFGSVALSSNSIAMGSNSTSEGDASFAQGLESYSLGMASVAMGETSRALGDHSIAIGFDAVAEGSYSISLGKANHASGPGSFTTGYSNSATGNVSIALGSETSSVAFASTSLGERTTASSYASVVIGRNNATEGDPTIWVETDPLFVVGNGTGLQEDEPEVQNRNAFLVRKNGDVEMTGKVRMPKQGDISMGEFGNEQ